MPGKTGGRRENHRIGRIASAIPDGGVAAAIGWLLVAALIYSVARRREGER
jgi:hypothetical protein